MDFVDIFGKKIDLGVDSSVYVEQVVGVAKKLDSSFGRSFKEFGIPKFAIVLGTSGPKGLIDLLDTKKVVPYSQIGFPISKAKGHAPEENGPEAKVHYGLLGGVPVLICIGRVHYYECRDMDRVTLMVRSICLLGIKDFIITNASGSLMTNQGQVQPGSIVVVTDFINEMGDSPLVGNEDYFHTFTDPNKVLDRSFVKKFDEFAKIKIYIAVTGRNFETVAEANKFAQQGHLMGMSSVPEVLAIAQQGGRVLLVSLVTNLVASKYSFEEVTHEANLMIVEEKDEEFSNKILKFVTHFKEGDDLPY